MRRTSTLVLAAAVCAASAVGLTACSDLQAAVEEAAATESAKAASGELSDTAYCDKADVVYNDYLVPFGDAESLDWFATSGDKMVTSLADLSKHAPSGIRAEWTTLYTGYNKALPMVKELKPFIKQIESDDPAAMEKMTEQQAKQIETLTTDMDKAFASVEKAADTIDTDAEKRCGWVFEEESGEG
jgi:hypothetical protein